MRFMMFISPGVKDEAAWEPTAEAVAAMTRYNEELTKAGVLLALDGLHPSSEGARVSFTGGKSSVTDGPFTEAKELIGGYWLIQAKSKEEAVEWASRCPAGDDDVIEVRRVAEMSDFPPDVQAAAELSEEPPEQTAAR
ncbi:YciI family protein [soil metagenome]